MPVCCSPLVQKTSPLKLLHAHMILIICTVCTSKHHPCGYGLDSPLTSYVDMNGIKDSSIKAHALEPTANANHRINYPIAFMKVWRSKHILYPSSHSTPLHTHARFACYAAVCTKAHESARHVFRCPQRYVCSLFCFLINHDFVSNCTDVHLHQVVVFMHLKCMAFCQRILCLTVDMGHLLQQHLCLNLRDAGCLRPCNV